MFESLKQRYSRENVRNLLAPSGIVFDHKPELDTPKQRHQKRWIIGPAVVVIVGILAASIIGGTSNKSAHTPKLTLAQLEQQLEQHPTEQAPNGKLGYLALVLPSDGRSTSPGAQFTHQQWLNLGDTICAQIHRGQSQAEITTWLDEQGWETGPAEAEMGAAGLLCPNTQAWLNDISPDQPPWSGK